MMYFYCKQCLRLYTRDSCIKKQMDRETFCPVHNKTLYLLCFKNNPTSAMLSEYREIERNFLTEQSSMKFIDISSLPADRIMSMYNMLDFD